MNTEAGITKQIYAMLRSVGRIGVVVHTNPDGDALGSMNALALLLQRTGKEVLLYVPESYPENYRFLPLAHETRATFSADDAIDILVALDCGSEGRITRYEDLRRNVRQIINIDHHGDNTRFGDINWVSSYASVGEMIYELAVDNGLLIDSQIATCLYVSLYTDTGGFRFPNTTPHAFEVAARLLQTGFNMPATVSAVYEQKRVSELHQLGTVLSSVVTDARGEIAWAFQPLEAYGISYEAIDYLRSIQGIRVAVLFKQVEAGTWKISFRSSGDPDVRSIAAHFGGGGHCGAAGALLHGEQESVAYNVINYVQQVVRRQNAENTGVAYDKSAG